ncbi:MAG: exodeoxyribonuclease VII large subunit [Nitrospirae bacterium]|nr:exodeoxyribonuclease VII large subunit [Nitrospirota bacterium]
MSKAAFSLYELNTAIKSAISAVFPEACWVTAEIAELKCNQRGHCYLELVEKMDDKTIAQSKATIWAYEYRKLINKFQSATNETLRPGMKIMFLAAVNYHEVYGLSLNIRDIDPAYTLGEMALKRKEVIERLRKEGLLDMNKNLRLPTVPQRIAVISSPTAAGHGDFFNQLDTNPYGYKFMHILFPVVVQGPDAGGSIIAALLKVRKYRHLFDVVVIIRGGGSAVDLSCFDAYELAAQIASCPLPVITGIGHEKDDTVADIVAHTRMKTPTAVAEFLISGLRSFEDGINDLRRRVKTYSEKLLLDLNYRLNSLARHLAYIPGRAVSSRLNKLLLLQSRTINSAKQRLQKGSHALDTMEQALRLLDPANVLKRGYSITSHNGKPLKDSSAVGEGEVIETTLFKGSIVSITRKQRGTRSHEQKQSAFLLPGFDGAGTDNK